MKATDAHLMDDEKRRKWGMSVPGVERDSFVVERAEVVQVGIIDEDEFTRLTHCWM